jgi:hypothetical protein
MAPRQFSLQEAESLLPRLTELLSEMRTIKLVYDHYLTQASELTEKMRGNGHSLESDLKEAQDGVQRTASEINRLAEEMNEMGCELKGLDEGLIDFRTEMGGREVYLCWKLPEARIEWWHELDTGFAGRQPLPREAAGQ